MLDLKGSLGREPAPLPVGDYLRCDAQGARRRCLTPTKMSEEALVEVVHALSLNRLCRSSQQSVNAVTLTLPYPPDMEKNGDGKTAPAALMFRFISEAGITQREFADRVGVTEQVLTNWKSRGIPRGMVTPVAHAMRLSTEQYWLNADAKPRKAIATRRVRTATTDAIPVPIFDVEGSMGGGRVVGHEPVIGGMQLSKDWARGHLGLVTSFNNLAVISAFGDSMAPTFNDGDILLIDRGVNAVKADAVYVLGRGDDLIVKRVQVRFGGELVIRSDNPLFDPETVRGADLERVRILGRVVWAWNGKRL